MARRLIALEGSEVLLKVLRAGDLLVVSDILITETETNTEKILKTETI